MSQTSVEGQIKESLISLLAGIKRADDAVIGSEMARLEEIVARDRGSLEPQLAHFLQRRSYAKALAYLGGDVPESGTCTPRP